MNEKLLEIKKSALERIAKANDLQDIEGLRVEFLGKKSEIATMMKGMGSLTPEERPIFGGLINEVRGEIERAIGARHGELEEVATREKMERERLDVTIPGNRQNMGRIHPLNKVLNQICDIFISMGFEIADGPEIETDYYNFEALNIPKDHPARDSQDTFYVELGVRSEELGVGGNSENVLLRTQTSPVQIRVMEKKRPPIRIIAPGRVYRSDAVDATHSPMFHQIEGLVIDRGITFGMLKGCLEEFVHKLYGEDVKTRFRPHHFQFTEPSAEMDISCPACGGSGCHVCKGEGWIEILGAGMVHRNVLKRGNIDFNEYSGFAFGMGLERLAMRALGVNDLRLFYENDVRFLEQF